MECETGADSSRYAELRRSINKPSSLCVKSEAPLPGRVVDETEGRLSEQPEPRSNRGEPHRTRAVAGGQGPGHARLCGVARDPNDATSITNGEEAKSVHDRPGSEAVDPARAE